ncbi:MAG: tetratricopeptide repeat protein, partial [Acidobacteriota bacterium]
WEKAVSLYKQGQFRAAVTEFQNVVAEFPNHSDSWKFIGLALYQLKEYDQALPALQKALALKQAEGKPDPDLLLAISRVQISLKKYDQALPFLENLARQRPDLASNRYMLGVAYANLNRNDEAIEAFRAAVKLAPQDADAWQYLSIQQFRSGKLNEAMASLRSGVAVAPKNVEMLALLAETLLRQAGTETNAVRSDALIEESIRVATSLRAVRDDAVSAELQGRAYLAAKKYPLAEQSLLRAVSLNKQPTGPLYFNLGFAQAQSKAWLRAVESFQTAERLGSKDVNTLYYLGFVYENLRRYPEALDAYNRAYEAGGRTNQDLKATIDRIAPFAKPQ